MATAYAALDRLAQDITQLQDALRSRAADWEERLARVQDRLRELGRHDLAVPAAIDKAVSLRGNEPPIEIWVLCDKAGYPLLPRFWSAWQEAQDQFAEERITAVA
jgi:hypothetical protein